MSAVSEPCICLQPGFCTRYKTQMGPNRFSVCKGEFGWTGAKREEYLSRLLARSEGREQYKQEGKPGTEAKLMFEEIGRKIETGEECDSCAQLVEWMDEVGIHVCRKYRDAIALRIKQNALAQSMTELLYYSANALRSSWAGEVDPRNVFGSIVDIAIRRAEAKLLASPSS